VKACPHCGAVRKRFDRFVLQGEYPAVLIDGERVRMGRTRENILALLVRNGHASYEEIDAMLRDTTKADAGKVHISYLRRVLPFGFEIRNLRGYGYELVRISPASPATTRRRPTANIRP
jgi:DNA-binding response OmpR family regulator